MSKKDRKWTERDVRKWSRDSRKLSRQAGHDANNDMAKETGWGIPKNRHKNK